MLLLAPYGGVVADRVDKRRLMIVLQIAMGLQALALGLLTVLGAVRFWQVCALAVILGGPAVSCARACATRHALPPSPLSGEATARGARLPICNIAG